MKAITEELIYKLHKSRAGIQKVSWNQIFDTEDELVEAMFR